MIGDVRTGIRTADTLMSIAAPPLAPSSAPTDVSRGIGRSGLRVLGATSLVALPALLTIYLSFNSGGYFPGATATAAAILAGGVVIRMALAREPFAGFSRPLAAVVAALAAYSVWTLISASWSHSPSRALLAFDLSNVYLFAVILFGSASRSDLRVRWMAGLVWTAMLAVCIAAVATRLRPDLFPIPANLSPQRLAFPLTYWNALGLFAVLGLALAAHFASSTQQPGLVRVIGAASAPVFAITILLTYSRAAVALGPAILIAYAVLARPRGLIPALCAAVPTSALVVAEAYQAKLISNGLTSAAAVQQGRHLTTTLLLACAAAALVRFALLPVDTRLAQLHFSGTASRRVKGVLMIAAAAALLVAGLGFSGRISHEWHALTGSATASSGDVRSHLDTYSLSDRSAGWHIALQMFNANPVRGVGADTFELAWERFRPDPSMAIETHSLYLQALSELGLVGLVLLLTPILTLIGTCLVRARRSSRSLWVLIALLGLTWAVHAGIDWDWQMPAVTLPVFALMAAGLARGGRRPKLRRPAEVALRVLVGTIAVAAMLVAVRLAVSDAHVSRSVNDFNTGNCPSAVVEARAAISAASSRPQPYAVVGFCDVRSGRPQAAIAAMRAAETRDPLNWRYHYDLAIAQASAGHSPRPQLKIAARLDPLETDTSTALSAFSPAHRRSWRRIAQEASPPVELRQ